MKLHLARIILAAFICMFASTLVMKLGIPLVLLIGAVGGIVCWATFEVLGANR